MSYSYFNTNSKALNLDAIKNSKSKVTLGLKCEPELKIRLAALAEEKGLTLSNYSELILSSSIELDPLELSNKTVAKNITLNELEEKVNFYESPFLKELFTKYKGQNINYIDKNNNVINTHITDIRNVYTVLINSFKIKP